MKKTWVLWLCLLFSHQSFAARVFVEGATGSSVNVDEMMTATELVKTSVPEVSSNTVVEQPEQADFFLRPHLMRLGGAVVLGLSKVEKDGHVDFSSQLKAEQIDELDKVARRLTRSVLRESVAAQDQRVGEITNQESHDGIQRRPARKAWYVGLGGAALHALNVDGIGYSLGVAYAWDLNTALLKLMAEGSGLNNAFMASVGLGGNYFFSRADVAPYAAADFGLGAAKAVGGSGFFSGDTRGGFDLGAGGGVQLLRSASVNLDIGFRAGFLLKQNGFGTPEAFSLRLGIYL